MDGWQSGEGGVKGSVSGGLNPSGDVLKEMGCGNLRRVQTYEAEVCGKVISNGVLGQTKMVKVEDVDRVDGQRI